MEDAARNDDPKRRKVLATATKRVVSKADAAATGESEMEEDLSADIARYLEEQLTEIRASMLILQNALLGHSCKKVVLVGGVFVKKNGEGA